MGVEVPAGNCFRWSQPLPPHSPSSSPRTTSFTSSSPSTFSPKRPRGSGGSYGSLPSLLARQSNRRSSFLGTSSNMPLRSRTCLKGCWREGRDQSVRRAFTAGLELQDNGDEEEEEFVRRLHELATELQEDSNLAQNCHDHSSNWEAEVTSPLSSYGNKICPSAESPWPPIILQPPKWLDEPPVPASVEMKANSTDLSLSLRIIKRKKQRKEQAFKGATESACCSIKKAFSSMVFMVRELQSYTLQMREIPFCVNLQAILATVQEEMNASFVWLFQQIFSCTPTLMVYVMLLLANFTVYSIGSDSAIAIPSCKPPVASAEREYQQAGNQQQNSRFHASTVKSFSVGGTASVGGSDGGGGKLKLLAGAADDGRSDGSHRPSATHQEEMAAWNRIVGEAHRMRASSTDEGLMDSDTLQQLVSPVTVELEPENYAEYSEAENMYLRALSQDPDNVLLLSNFAQFLYLVLHDHDRAECYFRRAVGIEPKDAEALHRYANFLWLARKDLGAAEEAYLEAIGADPSNTYYAANYAHFLWNTGGEDTCYPLDSSDAC